MDLSRPIVHCAFVRAANRAGNQIHYLKVEAPRPCSTDLRRRRLKFASAAPSTMGRQSTRRETSQQRDAEGVQPPTGTDMTIEALTRVVQLTHEIHDAVRQRDWLRAEMLVSERSPLLMSLTREQSPHALVMIREIQTLDEQISEAARVGLDTLTQENAKARQRIQSVRQYHAVGML
ncbi:flagellar protein FliT [Paraburkholderia piptadeniae]|nr:flagellar protein FliT [Paraburkholderia piptadeniae]